MKGYRSVRVAGAVFRLILTLGILAVVGIVVWRVFFSTKIPDEVRDLQKNDALTAAWETYGDNLTFRRQEQATITRGEHNNGYFSVVDCVFIPEAAQVQLVFRYNNSTIRHLARDYQLDRVPDKGEELFEVTLLRTTDLTPEDKSDNGDPATLAEERFYPTSAVRAETSLYTYYRFVFDGVTVEGNTDGVFADIYYRGDIDYKKTPYGALCLCADGDAWLPYSLSSGDRKALGKK